MGVPPQVVFAVHVLIQFPGARHQPEQRAQVRVAAVHFFLEHHAVEPLARRVGQQLFRQRDVLLAGETKTVNDFRQFGFGFLDALGNLHLLLAREQRHLPHLLEIHPHRVVKDVQPRPVFLLNFRLFNVIRVRLVHNFDFQRAELGKSFVQPFRRHEIFRQRLVDVAVGQMPLLAREPHQFLDFFRQLRVRAVLKNQDGIIFCGWLTGGGGDAAPAFFQG